MTSYIKFDETGRLTAWAAPGFRCGDGEVEAVMPEDFDPDRLSDYVYQDGTVVLDPLPAPEEPERPGTLEQRLANVEAELAAYKAAYEEGVKEAWA